MPIVPLLPLPTALLPPKVLIRRVPVLDTAFRHWGEVLGTLLLPSPVQPPVLPLLGVVLPTVLPLVGCLAKRPSILPPLLPTVLPPLLPTILPLLALPPPLLRRIMGRHNHIFGH